MNAKPPRPPRVVVGVDASSLAGLRALRCAVDEARRRKAQLHAMRVWAFNGTTRSAYQLIEQHRGAAIAAVESAFAEAMGEVPFDLDVVLQVVAGGNPARILVQSANCDQDLLVVGASGGGALRRFLRRSVARSCAKHAVCPVLVVPPTAFARQASHHSIARDVERDLLQPT
jgi:nucleotide-binding universal stress UspA family protein